ncbi:MAG: hypothetical protein EA369_06775 [Bradymonadales bacterium]|nr:MAG: hypothetical protein EA369_06775 [Bradymonadales bacterium]
MPRIIDLLFRPPPLPLAQALQLLQSGGSLIMKQILLLVSLILFASACGEQFQGRFEGPVTLSTHSVDCIGGVSGEGQPPLTMALNVFISGNRIRTEILNLRDQNTGLIVTTHSAQLATNYGVTSATLDSKSTFSSGEVPLGIGSAEGSAGGKVQVSGQIDPSRDRMESYNLTLNVPGCEIRIKNRQTLAPVN